MPTNVPTTSFRKCGDKMTFTLVRATSVCELRLSQVLAKPANCQLEDKFRYMLQLGGLTMSS